MELLQDCKIDFIKLKKEIKTKKYSLIGIGTSRKVYDLQNGTVAKVAMNIKGIAQNKTEVQIFEEDNGDCYPIKIFATVFEFSDDLKIIIVEKCTKVKGMKIVKKSLDISNGKEIEASFYDAITEIANRFELMRGDLERPSSWGLNSKDEPVLIDYGCTRKVFDKYYSYC